MYILAIHYTTTAELTQVQSLAKILGKTPYEVRPRLSIPVGGPAIVGVYAQQEHAERVATQLRDCGFMVVLLHEDEADPSKTQFEVRRFALHGQQLFVESRQGEQLTVDMQHVDLLLRGVSFSSGSSSQTITKKKFSLARTAMTGGIVRNKKTTTTQSNTTTQSDGVLYVCAKNQPTLVLSENGLLYESLGDAMKPSRAANFLYLVGEIRRLAFHAIYDERLLRRAGQKQLLGLSLEPETHLHIATHLLSKVLINRST